MLMKIAYRAQGQEWTIANLVMIFLVSAFLVVMSAG